VQQRNVSKWGIWICTAWALVLAFLAVANLLLLSQIVAYSNGQVSQGQIWAIFMMNIIFGLAFAASTFGLWRRHNWGRLLFIWAIVIWSAINLVALFIPGFLFPIENQPSAGELTLGGVRFAVGLVLPLWYLNLPRIKTLFYNE